MSFGSLVKNDLNSHNYSFTSHSRWHLMDATAVAATAAATATVCCHLSLRAYLSAFLSLSLEKCSDYSQLDGVEKFYTHHKCIYVRIVYKL